MDETLPLPPDPRETTTTVAGGSSVTAGNSALTDAEHHRVPPLEVPELDFEEFLGAGAYGEVWKAREKNTGRDVAVKFYLHRQGMDGTFLSQEVEKLSFLFSDRHVVQLLHVGWDSDPPYYVMEYMDSGSLSDEIHRQTLSPDAAVQMLREIAVGVHHAHQKGMVHCDLKPGNILLDRDGNPRLADFGQSRLSSDMAPALGTLFYMAPEQASLSATPDVRWDVYALGAILYAMMMGHPPHYDPELVEKIHAHQRLSHKLRAYRRALSEQPVPVDYRMLPGMDFFLVKIVEKCLSPDPEERFQDVGTLLEAISTYLRRKSLRPLVLLGGVTPVILLLMVSFFVAWALNVAVTDGRKALINTSLRSDRFAAQLAAKTATYELFRRYEAVERVAGNYKFRQAVEHAISSSEWQSVTEHLLNPELPPREQAVWQEQFLGLPERETLQTVMEEVLPDDFRPKKLEGEILKEATISPVKRVAELEISQIVEGPALSVGQSTIIAGDEFHAGGKENAPAAETPGNPQNSEKSPPQKNSSDEKTLTENKETEKVSSSQLSGEFGSLGGPALTPLEIAQMKDFQKRVHGSISEYSARLRSDVANWTFFDYQGISTTRVPYMSTLGKDFAWCTFFTGETENKERGWRPPEGKHLKRIYVSPAYRSPISGEWVITIASPVFGAEDEKRFLGVIAMAVGVGRFIQMQNSDSQFSVLVDNRPGNMHGLILQHPLYDEIIAGGKAVPPEFMDKKYHVDFDKIQRLIQHEEAGNFYRDPVALNPLGKSYDKNWLVQYETINLGQSSDGEWAVLVQESYDESVGSVLNEIEKQVLRMGMLALGSFLVVLFTMWYFARRNTRFY